MKILTALNNNNLVNQLKKEFKYSRKYMLVHKDIIYKEGVIEYLKTNKDVNLIVLNTSIDGEIDVYDLIKKILEINKYIEIIIIIQKDKVELRKFLSSYNINKVLVEGNFTLDDLIILITNNKNIKQKLIEKEIEELRQLVFNKDKKTIKNQIKNKIKKIKENRNKREKIKKEKIKDKTIKQKERKSKNKNKIYFTVSEDIQKYNIDSIEIIVNIRK